MSSESVRLPSLGFEPRMDTGLRVFRAGEISPEPVGLACVSLNHGWTPKTRMGWDRMAHIPGG